MSEAVLVRFSTGAVPDRRQAEASAPVRFDEFVAARGADLWRSAWLLTGDAHKAEDLVQAALLKCWRRWDSIAADGSVEGYVRRTLVTTYTDWWRRKWNAETPSDAVPEEVKAASQADETVVLAERRDLLAALATLTRGQRAVLVLRYFEDLTEAETAATLGVSVGTVKSQAARAMTALRSSPLLADEEETP